MTHACHQCFSIKQKCDAQSPCARCSRLGLDCTQRQPARRKRRLDQIEPNDEGNRVEQPRQRCRAANIRRDRTGCDSCKRRKKKCDELKPKCSDCRRLNLSCTRSSTWRSHREDSQPSQLNPTSPTSPVSQYSENEALQITNSSPVTDTQSSSTEPIQPTNHAPEAAQSSPVYQWLIRDNFTGLSDEIDHSYVTDDSLVLSQQNSPKRNKVPESNIMINNDNNSYFRWLPFNPMSIPYSLTVSPLDYLTNKHDKHLFQHYTQIVSRSLSIASGGDSNPFLREVVPLAAESSAVMGALLALSAIHLKYNGGYGELVQRGLNRQINAISALNDLIALGSSNTLFKVHALAAILLFCIIDIREGNSSRWSWHIVAAKTVVASANDSSESMFSHASSWTFLLDIFEYVDSVITISKCKPPLIDHEKLRPEEESCSTVPSLGAVLSVPSSRQYNATFGVARPLFRIIGQISALSSRRKHRIKPLFDEKFRKIAADIEAKLHAWMPPNISGPGIPQPSSSQTVFENDVREATHAAVAIKWASLLRLHQIVDGYAIPHPVPSRCLHEILTNLQYIRVGSAVESLMVFPLIMAGSVALSKADRMTIRSRWLIIERTIGFGNISKGGQMTEKVWEAMDREINCTTGEPGRVNVNWASIRWHEYGDFVMF